MEKKVAKAQIRTCTRMRILHWTSSMKTGKNLNQVRNIITVIPYLETESQVILILIIIASLGKSKIFCAN